MRIYLQSYLFENLGDDLFIDIITKRYRNHKFYAISKGFKNYNYNNLKVYSNTYTFRALKRLELEKYLANRLDLAVTIGGSMYMEKTDKIKDHSLGENKHYILGANFGPYTSNEYYDKVKGMFEKAEDVCFREKYSYELFKDLTNVRYASDIAFLTDISNVKITDRKRAIISVVSAEYKIGKEYKNKYEDKIIELCNFLIMQGYEVCLMSFCKFEGDENAIKSILNEMNEELKNKIQTYYYNENIEEALNVIGDSQVVFGGRFHANIIGLLLGKSIIPMPYDYKTKHVLDDMGIDCKIININEISSFNVQEITREELTKKYNVSNQIKDAARQFEKLDLILKG